MIPFNHLGFVFKYFGSFIYPSIVKKEICEFVKPLPNEAYVLDIGAGTGMISKFAHRCNTTLNYVAADPAEGMLKYAESYVDTHVASAEALPFDDDSFDAVLMGEALHHFNDTELAMKEVVRVLRKNGKLFIYDFDKGTFLGNTLCTMEKLLGEPGNFYDVDSLKKMLESHGFYLNISKHGWRYTVSATLMI